MTRLPERELILPAEVQNKVLKRQLTGADAIAASIAGISSDIHGLGGGAIIRVLNAFGPWISERGNRFIPHRREDAAVYAAMGESYITGKPAVVATTSGPAIGNAAAAIQVANEERIPLVIVVGQVATNQIGKGAFQQYPTEMLAQVTSWFHRLENPAQIPYILQKARYIADRSKGPVLIDAPVDIQKAPFEGELDIVLDEVKKPANLSPNDLAQIQAVAAKINETDKVLIIAGPELGRNMDSARVKAIMAGIAEAGNIPFTTTLTAIPYAPREHPLYIGSSGIIGDSRVETALKSAELVLGLGLSFNEPSLIDKFTENPSIFGPNARIISVNNDPELFFRDPNRRLQGDLSIRANALAVSKIMLSMLTKRDREAWIKQVSQPSLAENHSKDSIESIVADIPAADCLHQLSDIVEEDAILVVEAGQSVVEAANHFDFRNNRRFVFLTATGPMGFALPFAIGMKLNDTDRPVYVVMGDQSVHMNEGEFATLQQSFINKSITRKFGIIIFDNEGHDMVRRPPHNGTQPFTDLWTPDFSMLLNAYGIRNERIDDRTTSYPALVRLRNAEDPYGVWVKTPKYSYMLKA